MRRTMQWGLTFILAKTDLDWRAPSRLGTACGEAKKDCEDLEPFRSQSGRADASMTMTEDSSRLSVLISLPWLSFRTRGCCLKVVRSSSRPLSVWKGAAYLESRALFAADLGLLYTWMWSWQVTQLSQFSVGGLLLCTSELRSFPWCWGGSWTSWCPPPAWWPARTSDCPAEWSGSGWSDSPSWYSRGSPSPLHSPDQTSSALSRQAGQTLETGEGTRELWLGAVSQTGNSQPETLLLPKWSNILTFKFIN